MFEARATRSARALEVEKRMRQVTRAMLDDSNEFLDSQLKDAKLTFEGRKVYSLRPVILELPQVARLINEAEELGHGLEALLKRFKHEDSLLGASEKQLQKCYARYEKYFPWILRERRRSANVALARLDTVGLPNGPAKAVEANTLAPAGVIGRAALKRAWLASPLGQHLFANIEYRNFRLETTEGFLRYLFRRAANVSGARQPVVAILQSESGIKSQELTALEFQYQKLTAAHFDQGVLLSGDIRELEYKAGEGASLRGKKVDLIYNKFVPASECPGDPNLRGWELALESADVEFVNSVGAMIISEAKRSLAILRSAIFQRLLNIDLTTIRGIANLVPPCQMLESLAPEARSDLLNSKDDLVVKPDNLFRGKGVTLGSEVTQDVWQRALEAGVAQGGLVQQRVRTPFLSDTLGSKPWPTREYVGLDVFLLDGCFAGFGARTNESQILNVGNNGYIAPVFVL